MGFEILNHQKLGFYARKAFFQVLMPISLALMALIDFANQNGKKTNHLYIYTSIILFIYGAMKYFLEFIFSLTADDFVFRKEVNRQKISSELLIDININDKSNDQYIVVIKKIFKIKYSNYLFFQYIVKICYFLGFECPFLIPQDAIMKLNDIIEDINEHNEDMVMYSVLSNLYTYHPTKYTVNPIINDTIIDFDFDKKMENDMVPKIIISKTDKIISEIQKELFNRINDIYAVNV